MRRSVVGGACVIAILFGAALESNLAVAAAKKAPTKDRSTQRRPANRTNSTPAQIVNGAYKTLTTTPYAFTDRMLFDLASGSGQDSVTTWSGSIDLKGNKAVVKAAVDGSYWKVDCTSDALFLGIATSPGAGIHKFAKVRNPSGGLQVLANGPDPLGDQQRLAGVLERTANVQTLGPAIVNGQQVIRYRQYVGSAWMRDSSVRKALGPKPSLPVVSFIDNAGRVLRTQVTYTLPRSWEIIQSHGGNGVVTLTIDYSDYGSTVRPKVPAASETIAATDFFSALEALSGGA